MRLRSRRGYGTPPTRSFVSYDDPRSIELKSAYARERGLGGIMFWELSQDTRGALLDAAHRGLTGKQP